MTPRPASAPVPASRRQLLVGGAAALGGLVVSGAAAQPAAAVTRSGAPSLVHGPTTTTRGTRARCVAGPPTRGAPSSR